MPKPRILYACRANGGRLVASKVITEHSGRDAVEVFSAGSEPGALIHPEVAEELTALGLDDVVITQGCGESCPVYPGARYAD